ARLAAAVPGRAGPGRARGGARLDGAPAACDPAASRGRGAHSAGCAGTRPGAGARRGNRVRSRASARPRGRVTVGRPLLARALARRAAVRGGGPGGGRGLHARDRRGDEADEPRGRARGGHGRGDRAGQRRVCGVRLAARGDRHRRLSAVPPLTRVLVANRGEIAVRIIRGCFDEGIEAVLAASEADVDSLGAQLADRVVVIGPAPATESYLDVNRLVSAAKIAGCDGLHPGYGFVSERPELSEECADAGIAFVGPPPDAMRRSGDKATARATARELGIAIGEGSDVVGSDDEALAVARELGLPILFKAAA